MVFSVHSMLLLTLTGGTDACCRSSVHPEGQGQNPWLQPGSLCIGYLVFRCEAEPTTVIVRAIWPLNLCDVFILLHLEWSLKKASMLEAHSHNLFILPSDQCAQDTCSLLRASTVDLCCLASSCKTMPCLTKVTLIQFYGSPFLQSTSWVCHALSSLFAH